MTSPSELAHTIDFPVLKNLASDVSVRAQSRALWAVRLQLVLAVSLSLLSDASTLLPISAESLRTRRGEMASATGWTWLDAPLSTYLPGYLLFRHAELWWVALLVTAGILLSLLYVRRDMDQHRLWFEARAGAESVKTATWRFMMHIDPFEGLEPLPSLAEVLRRILAGNALLERMVSTSGDAVLDATQANRDVRALCDWGDRREVYRAARLEDQIGWYTRGANANRERARRYRTYAALSWALAIGLAWFRALAASLANVDVNFVATAAALAAALVGWSQAKRFDELATSYATAARELKAIRTELCAALDEGAFVRAVLQSEQAISREHTMWVAKSYMPDLVPESFD